MVKPQPRQRPSYCECGNEKPRKALACDHCKELDRQRRPLMDEMRLNRLSDVVQ